MWESTMDGDDDDDSDDDPQSTNRTRKSENGSAAKKRRRSSNLDESSSEEETPKKKSPRKRQKGDIDASDSELGESNTSKKRRRVESSHRQVGSKKRKSFKANSESEMESDSSPHKHSFALLDSSFSNAYVYRAIRPERLSLGWTQAPCGNCPVFDFCKDKGPVNPKECHYFEGWLDGGVVSSE